MGTKIDLVSRLRGCVIGCFCASLLISAGTLSAAKKAEKRKIAEELVKEALHREVYGMSADRAELLEKAAKTVPDYAPAMWHRGYVRHNNRWVKADEVPQLTSDDKRLAAYQKVRGGYEDTSQDQLELANWCEKRGLKDQERAHLNQVIRLEPNHAEARARLGFRRVNGNWVASEEIAATAEQLRTDRKNLEEWRPKIQEILKGLKHKSELKRKTAKERLAAIHDPAALSAIEQVLGTDGEQAAQIAVAAIDDNFVQNAAALSLARLAVNSPWQSVRDDAAKRLRDRPKDAFVPAMLASIFTPIQSRVDVFRDPRGRLQYRHSFFREGQDEKQLMVLDTEYRRIALPGGNRRDSTNQAFEDIQANAEEAERAVAMDNARTVERNNRVTRALSMATDQVLAPTPGTWWDWWTQYNGVFIEGQKPTQTVQETRQVAIVDRTVQSSDDQGVQQVAPRPQRYPRDCLAAGTNVWTAAGPVAIEKIKIGDLVLSQNVDTGELAYKPVLRTTVRPKSILVRILAETETIETSAGHPFWISGEGWIKARELKPGMELHSVEGTTRISTVQRSGEEVTYNLIVADFNTYFVGQKKVLSHDNTVRETTDAIVPGLMDN